MTRTSPPNAHSIKVGVKPWPRLHFTSRSFFWPVIVECQKIFRRWLTAWVFIWSDNFSEKNNRLDFKILQLFFLREHYAFTCRKPQLQQMVLSLLWLLFNGRQTCKYECMYACLYETTTNLAFRINHWAVEPSSIRCPSRSA